jgi:hypothetical protein
VAASECVVGFRKANLGPSGEVTKSDTRICSHHMRWKWASKVDGLVCKEIMYPKSMIRIVFHSSLSYENNGGPSLNLIDSWFNLSRFNATTGSNPRSERETFSGESILKEGCAMELLAFHLKDLRN